MTMSGARRGRMSWRGFNWAMLGLLVAMIVAVSIGIHFGWMH